jgi:hypothetical protein
LFLRDPGQPTEIVDLDLGLKGVALSYNGFGDPETRVRFPLPVVEASGHVHLRSDILSIEDVTAHLAPEAGGGDVRMSGRVNVSHDHRGEVHIDLDVPKLTFTTALRTALGTLVRDDGALYDQFQPRGAAAVRLQVRPQGDPEGQWQVQIDALGGDLTWSGFPLTLGSVQGRVLASDDGMKIDLSGRRGDATLEVKGSLRSPAERPGAITSGPIDLRIRAKDVPLDSDLRAAAVKLSPDLDNVDRLVQRGPYRAPRPRRCRDGLRPHAAVGWRHCQGRCAADPDQRSAWRCVRAWHRQAHGSADRRNPRSPARTGWSRRADGDGRPRQDLPRLCGRPDDRSQAA